MALLRRLSFALAAAALAVSIAAGDERKNAGPSASSPSTTLEMTAPASAAPEGAVTVAVTPAARGKDSAWAGVLKGIQSVSMSEGQARLIVDGKPVSVRPGDTIGTDVVRTITPDRIVLTRPASGHIGEATVVVRFDAEGRSRVRVYAAKDPTAIVPPQGN